MLKYKFAAKTVSLKKSLLLISGKNLAMDVSWCLLWSDCFLFLQSISHMFKTSGFTSVLPHYLSSRMVIFYAFSISVTNFTCHIPPLLDEDIHVESSSFLVSLALQACFHTILPSCCPVMPFSALLHSWDRAQTDQAWRCPRHSWLEPGHSTAASARCSIAVI